MAKVIIMQGVSGAGKSTWIKKNHPKALVCSADHYFLDKNGKYNFRAEDLGKAHQECLKKFLHELHDLWDGYERPPIIVDNTNCALWEMAPYVQAGAAFGWKVEVVRLVCDPAIAAGRNAHGVPEKSVKGMAARMEKPLKFWACTYREEVTDGSR